MLARIVVVALSLLIACGPGPELEYATRAVAIGDEAALAALAIDSLATRLFRQQASAAETKDTPHPRPDSTLEWTSRLASPLQEARRVIGRAPGDLQLIVPPDRLRTVHEAILPAMTTLARSATATFVGIAGNGQGRSSTEWADLRVAGNIRRSGLIEYFDARDRMRRLVPGADRAIATLPALDSVVERYPH